MSKRDDNIAVFIDGSNLYATAKTLGFDIDYKKLPSLFDDMGNVLRLFYFTAVKPEGEHSTLRPLLDYLAYNGYIVVEKLMKVFDNTDTGGVRKLKGNMDLEMASKMIKLASQVDHIIIFTGDGDFRCIVEHVQDMGCHVTVISTILTNPPMCADELRRQADTFLDLGEDAIKAAISRGGHVPPLRSAIRGPR